MSLEGLASEAMETAPQVESISNQMPEKMGIGSELSSMLPEKMEPKDVTTPEKTVTDIPESKYKEGEVLSDYKERLEQTPTKNVTWEGKKGESKAVALDENVREVLSQYGVDGIEYKNGLPDFSPVSEQTVRIDMKSDRIQNFKQADTKCAEQWNQESRNDRTDWTAREVNQYRHENNLSWHECSDRKTCQLVSQDIHKTFTHYGGVVECKLAKAEMLGSKLGGFDA